MRRSLVACFMVVLSVNLSSQQEPRIAEIVGKIQVANIQENLKGLQANESGLRGYDANGKPQEGLVKARDFIAHSLANSLGPANLSKKNFQSQNQTNMGVNVIGVLPGKTQPHTLYVISAHYDSVQNPGANDDGSGVAGVLEIARVLGRYEFDATLVFACFDLEEEQPTDSKYFAQGSLAYLNQAGEATVKKIKAMLSLDMIAYHAAGDNVMTLSRCDSEAVSAASQLQDRLSKVIQDYTSLRVNTLPGENASDAWRFSTFGVPAALVTERLNDKGWPLNTFYHTANDFYLNADGALQQYNGSVYIDTEYASQIVKGVTAWIALEAGLLRARD